MKNLILILSIVSAAAYLAAREWQPDVLGPRFEMTKIQHPDDYSGPVVSTVIRHSATVPGGKGVLYVHGYNDYFFQDEMADSFAAHGYNFYAVDLRKYGRSLLPGQTRFELRDISEYYADIDSALTIMRHQGLDTLVLLGHSTGGLTSACFMAANRQPGISALVLDSPFLDWNLSSVQEKFLIPAVRSISPLMPRMEISQGNDGRYGSSLHKDYGGEWYFDTSWKLIQSPPVQVSWIAAIDAAHDIVQNYPGINVPILLMHSDNSVHDGAAADAWHQGDAVLDVEDISRYGRRLGIDVTEITVRGGIHDLVLSAPDVRRALYAYLFSWLAREIR